MALFACTLTSALALTSSTTRGLGLARTLDRLAPPDTAVVASVFQGSGRPLEPALGTVTAAIDGALAVPVAARREATASEWAYADGVPLPTSMVFFGHMDDVGSHLRVLAGHLPRADERAPDGALAVAVPRSLAEAAQLEVGSRLSTIETTTDARRATLVVGVYEITPLQALDPFWTTDLLGGATFDPGVPAPRSYGMYSLPAYGPLLTPRASFTAGGVHPFRSVVTTVPDLSGTTPAQLSALQQRVTGIRGSVSAQVARDTVRDLRLSTPLTATLDVVNRALVVTTAGLLISGLLVVVLTVAALLLATRLLAERRSTEQTLMRARGASGTQLAALAVLEAAVLALTVAAASPLLARPLYLALARTQLFRDAGLDRDPGTPPLAWGVSTVTAMILVTVLLTPLLRRAGTFVEQEQAAARQDRRSLLQRSGLDLALLALAALGYWQLLRYASPLAEGERGPSMDPLLLAGPALVRLAGGMLSVRAVPALARHLERLAAGRSLVRPLAAWEVGRRTRRSTGAVLLLALTVAAGTFSLADLATWRASQVDQADARVGADAVVDLSGAPGLAAAAPPVRLGAVADEVDARVEALMPALAEEVGLSVATDPSAYGRGTTVSDGVALQLLGVDSRRAAGMLRGRPASPDGPAAGLLRALPGLAPAPAGGTSVPSGTTLLGLEAGLRTENLPPGSLSARLTAVVDDAFGVRHRVELGDLTADGRAHRLLGDLSGLPPGPPAQLRGVQVEWAQEDVPLLDDQELPRGLLTLARLTARTAGGERPLSWAGFERAGIATAGVSGGSVTTGPVRLPGRSQDEAGLEASVFLVPDLGSSSFDSAMSASVVAWPTGEPVRVVATPEVLRQLGRRPGDDVALVVDRTAVPATVVAATPFVPGTDGHRDAVLVDADAFSRRLIEYGLDGPTANRWWLDVDDAGAARLADALAPLGGTTVGAAATARQAQRAPLAVGWQGARWLVVLAAGILACVGFALHTAVAIRLRRIEFAQLLSLGVRRRQLERVVATEGLLLWALGTACGLAVGLLLTRTLPSLVAMSAPFGRPVPPVAVHLAWWPTLVLVGVVAGMLGLVLAVVTRSLRASVLGAVLRLGDER